MPTMEFGDGFVDFDAGEVSLEYNRELGRRVRMGAGV